MGINEWSIHIRLVNVCRQGHGEVSILRLLRSHTRGNAGPETREAEIIIAARTSIPRSAVHSVLIPRAISGRLTLFLDFRIWGDTRLPGSFTHRLHAAFLAQSARTLCVAVSPVNSAGEGRCSSCGGIHVPLPSMPWQTTQGCKPVCGLRFCVRTPHAERCVRENP